MRLSPLAGRVTRTHLLTRSGAFLRIAFTLASATSLYVLPAAQAIGQSETTADQGNAPLLGLPLRAPGYELFYHDNSSPSAFANRWGYYDGWAEGRHDRQIGSSVDAKDHDKYKLAPDHGQHPGLDRETYKSLYRVAYLHGYDRGSKN